MKLSIFLATSGAVLAAATPILRGRRLFVETKVVVDFVTVTVTEGVTPTMFGNRRPSPKPAVVSSSPVAPAAPTTPPVVVVPEPTPEPKVEPTPEPTTAAPVVVPSPVAKAPEAPAAAPVVEAPKIQEAAAQAPSGDDYQSTALYHHNVHRANHSVPAVTWSQTYADYAATVAKSCDFKHDLSPGGGGYGQNIAMYAGTNAADDNASHAASGGIGDGWYNGELHIFPSQDYGKPNPDMKDFEAWGHFSQMVWKGTQQIGCATQFCPKGTNLSKAMDGWYTVCNYFPAGNMGGGYGENVLPPLGQPTVLGH
ncbi:CAP domain-containing protein [Podospora didyma]|uniref:CAP domain-containing protein n=1 Tax=Podospora didyma TaxID=330526 RepID=A0AAE0K9R3_9PEZI|nr:CAP domain-containing protein [Podospora didyma]